MIKKLSLSLLLTLLVITQTSHTQTEINKGNISIENSTSNSDNLVNEGLLNCTNSDINCKSLTSSGSIFSKNSTFNIAKKFTIITKTLALGKIYSENSIFNVMQSFNIVGTSFEKMDQSFRITRENNEFKACISKNRDYDADFSMGIRNPDKPLKESFLHIYLPEQAKRIYNKNEHVCPNIGIRLWLNNFGIGITNEPFILIKDFTKKTVLSITDKPNKIIIKDSFTKKLFDESFSLFKNSKISIAGIELEFSE